ncbi:hypothetical protein AMS68_005956 [Peltaster fructicola]|uniref:Uncharacterized protein n=1 Tax=Peltaster fructicola TaxID=286661 RepID=A0A6H0Y0P3_9PEZI|nr:hypothetical protein AMS68_005956 [Peltaster fructicola]
MSSEKSDYEHQDTKGKMKQRDDYDEPHDYEIHSKKDAPPPRFSTIFDTKPQPILAAEPVIESPRRRRRNGVFIPMPIFVLLAILFFLESIVLFAYTAIGLYNQLPGRLVTTIHGPTAAACDLAPPVEHQAAPINIAPNFVVGGAGGQSTVTETVTVTFMGRESSTLLPSLSSTSSSSTVSSSTTSSTTSSAPSMAIVTFTPGGGVVTSVVFVTPSPASQAERPTSFVTVFAGASPTSQSSSTLSTSASPVAKAVSQETSSSSSTTTSSSSVQTSTTTSSTSSSSTTSSSTTSTTPAAKGTNKACVGGAGAVMLDCL